jgi:hypothetical protein
MIDAKHRTRTIFAMFFNKVHLLRDVKERSAHKDYNKKHHFCQGSAGKKKRGKIPLSMLFANYFPVAFRSYGSPIKHLPYVCVGRDCKSVQRT